MSTFQIYFDEGMKHILDYEKGYDHIIFVVALCAVYLSREWKNVLILVTAFTIGHSITLALATLRIISVKVALVEFLIPLTIFITAIANLFKSENNLSGKTIQINYFFAGFFGLVHGLGFSSYLRAIMGKEKSIITPLFAFNVGLDLIGLNRRDWKMVISSAIAGIALMLMNENAYWRD